MGFKEFTKPSVIKILLAIVLLVMGVALVFWLIGECKIGTSAKCVMIIVLTAIFAWPALLGFILGPLAIILVIAWVYILACIIVATYNKVKKK